MRRSYIDNNDYSVFFDYLNKMEIGELASESVSVTDSLNRITAKAVYAKLSDPMYNASAMDGIAVVAGNTSLASDKNPLRLTINEDFVYVNTGNPIESKYDSVIMIEDVLIYDTEHVAIVSPSYPWQNVRVKGESVVEGEIILPCHRKVRPEDIGAILSGGNEFIEVIRKPTVGIIPTGNEMVESAKEVGYGKLMESNSRVFAALALELGASYIRYPIVKDDLNQLTDSLSQAASECDLVILNAGSSAGTKDFAVDAIASLGEVFAHGFAIKPGKPTILGSIKHIPVIGIPGYPVSAYFAFDRFVSPIIRRMTALEYSSYGKVTATLTRRVVSSLKNEELLRMALGIVDNKLVATPLERGAAQIMSLVKADGILTVPRESEGIEQGEEVEIILKKPLSEIVKQLVVIGSHDMILDILQDKMPLASAHVGSLGGITALLRQECHIAPIHLLDDDGSYNVNAVKKYFPNKKMALIKGVGRIQGILVPKGNPKGIYSLSDIAERKLCFANRQRGSGTRILFDYELKKLGISPQSIIGYQKEYNTHLAVAVAVQNGAGDCGLGIKAAAVAMGLDFVPIANEEYDFLTTFDRLSTDKVQSFIELIKSDFFKDEVCKLQGYSLDNIGDVIIIGNND